MLKCLGDCVYVIMAKRENKFAKTVRKEDVSNENFGLGRPFDFDDRFNRVAIIGALIATILLLIFRQVTGSGTGSVMLDGLSEKETEIQIFDISGRQLSTRNVTGSSSVMDVSDLASGCYVVRLLQGVSVQNVKLMVR